MAILKLQIFKKEVRKSDMSILSTANLMKQYGKEPNIVNALNGIDISIEQGEFVAIIGTSGSGKSTLLNMLGGLDRPTSGSVRVDNFELSKLNDEDLTVFRRQRIGFIFQNYNLVPVLNVYENITMPIRLDGKKPDRKFIQEVISLLGLEKKIYNMPNTLSGGQQQRVAIGRALITRPFLVLADEPTGNLDSKNSQDVMDLLCKASRHYLQTVLMITHNMNLAASSDRVFRVNDGMLKELGGAEE